MFLILGFFISGPQYDGDSGTHIGITR